jgi:exodeoxyribonuclease-1
MFRLIKDKAPDVWKSMMASKSKAAVFQEVEKKPTFVLTDRYGKNFHHFLVTICGMNGNQDAAVFDLQFNPDELLSLSVEELVEVLNANKKPIRALRANKQPIIMPTETAPDGAKALAIPAAERERRIKVIQGAKDFQQRVGQAMAMRYDGEEAPEYVEERIYSGGFPSNKDQARMNAFHEAKKSEEQIEIASQIEDERVKAFADRLIYFESPKVLPSVQRAKMMKWNKERLITTEKVPWMTVPKALKEIDEELAEASKEDVAFLKEIRPFIEKISASLG